jgi:glycosyltransferase involved in cell wall biosynthesis
MRELCKGFEEIGWSTAIALPGGAVERIARAGSPGRKRLKSVVPATLWEALRDLDRLRSDAQFDRDLDLQFGSAAPDVLYECLDYSGSATEITRRAFRGKYVVEIHAPLEEDTRLTAGARPLRALFSRRVRRALRQADHIVTVSGVVREWMMSEGISAEKIQVLPNGVDLRLFDPARFPEKPRGEIVVGFVGSDLVWHRLDALIDAFGGLPNEPKSRLKIVGVAASNEKLRDRVRDLGVDGDIEFLGSVPYERIPEVVASFDIAVMPGSNRYGSPIKLFEYGAMAKAVIAPDVAPVREVFENDSDVFLVPSGDVGKIRQAMERLIGDSGLRERLGNAMRKKVAERYSWSAIATAIAERVR